jgi:4-diphosphocytidyl-2-C-methyl-D-erythritol kinase
MTEYTTQAHAKLNLTLDVVGRRPDGFHDLTMVMQEITLGDTLTLCLGTGGPWRMVTDAGDIPADDTNLAMKAARLFFQETGLDCGGLTVTLQKRTPVCAGMGGGSADGAAVLRLLYDHYGAPISQETLYRLAEETGSDVPFALFGGTALAQEKGQVLQRLPKLPFCHIVLCKPPFPVSTPELFRALDGEGRLETPDTQGMLVALEAGDLQGIAAHLGNVFQPVVSRSHREILEIRDTLLRCGALGACMTGSGPTVFGLFGDLAQAQGAYDTLKATYADTFLTEPV